VGNSYDVSAWHDFATAVAGASAALAGLLFVAMSINVNAILSDAHLTPRAGAAVITLTTPVTFSVLVLVPGQTDVLLGVELVAFGVVVGIALAASLRRGRRGQTALFVPWLLGTAGPSALVAVSIVLAGVGTITTSIGGLSWLAVATVAAIYGGLVQAWVLLIEILR
jgi:hypothetical protein